MLHHLHEKIHRFMRMHLRRQAPPVITTITTTDPFFTLLFNLIVRAMIAAR